MFLQNPMKKINSWENKENENFNENFQMKWNNKKKRGREREHLVCKQPTKNRKQKIMSFNNIHSKETKQPNN